MGISSPSQMKHIKCLLTCEMHKVAYALLPSLFHHFTKARVVSLCTMFTFIALRPPQGVCEAHFHLAGKPMSLVRSHHTHIELYCGDPLRKQPQYIPKVCDRNALVKQCL